MSLMLKTEGDFEAMPKGQYQATCYRIVDMGTRTEQFGENDPKKRTTVHITFEVTKTIDIGNQEYDPTMDDGRPMAISRTYTASLFESSALRKDLVSWRGKNFSPEEEAGFDIATFLGRTAVIEVDHTVGGKAKIAGIFKPDGGAQKIATHNEQTIFDLDVYCDEFNGNSSPTTKAMCDIFTDLPEWQQKDIEGSYEYIAAVKKGESAGFKPAVSNESPNLADLATEAEQNNSPNFDDDAITEDKIPF